MEAKESSGLPQLEPHQQRLLTTVGFIEKYLVNTCRCHTNEKAYEITEREYMFVFGGRKYKNYETFKAVVHRHNKKESEKTVCQSMKKGNNVYQKVKTIATTLLRKADE